MTKEADRENAEACREASTGRRLLGRGGKIVCFLLIAYLVIVLAMLFLENLLIFVPARYPVGNWRPNGIAVEDVWFQSADGTRLHGWYVPHAKPQATVLFCHGNAGNITHRLDSLKMLHEVAGVSVLIFDYRGYGRSDGKPSETGILSDARAARVWLAAREKIGEKDIVVMGESIGGAVAVDLAASDGARALVLESTFDALPNVAAFHFPWLPVQWAMQTRFNSAAKIVKYRGPLLQAHGDTDTIVPFRFGQQLFAAANEPKTFLRLPGHDHNDGMPISFYKELSRFLEQLPPRGGM